MTYEFAITLAACLLTLVFKRDTLTFCLALSWAYSFSVVPLIPAGLLPLNASLVDGVIIIAAFYLWSEHKSLRAYIVGWISIAKLAFHFAISAHFGWGNWFAYALSVNSAFVVQCAIAGGFVGGMVGLFDRFVGVDNPRREAVHKRDEA